MHIGGLEKYSFIDYAPHISCVIFTRGCNFRCPYCHNPELVLPESYGGTVPENELFSFLTRRRKYLDAVVISGGEPTLQPDLPGFCARIKSMGFPLKLDTNGSRPAVLLQLISHRLVDYLAMDIKTDPEWYDRLGIDSETRADAIRESIELIRSSGLPHEFRTTCVKPLVDGDAIGRIAELVRGAPLYALQKPQTVKVLNPAFFTQTEWTVSDAELDSYRSVLQTSVRHCFIR